MVKLARRDIRELRKRLRAAGVFEREAAPQWRRFLLLGVLTVVASLAMALAPGPLWSALCVPVVALLFTPLVMHGHDAGHRALSKDKRTNTWMESLAFGLIGGMSTSWWKQKHNGPHHTHPNLISPEHVDPDIVFWPFATSAEQHAEAGPLRAFFQRNLQAWAFWPLTTVVHIRMRGQGLVFVVRGLLKPGPNKRGLLVEGALLLGHFAIFILLPAFLFGWLKSLSMYMGTWAVVSVLLSVIFVPAHVGMPILKSAPEFYASQLAGSRNYQAPRGLSWFFVGLQYQIEHHLFPTIPYPKLPMASVIVQSWAKELGLPYRTMSWWAALADSTRFLGRSWRTPSIEGDAEIQGEVK